MANRARPGNHTTDHLQAARFAKALSHPVRIAILERLQSQSCCYHGDMAVDLQVPKSTLSQHLNALKTAGLIQGSIEPPMVRYCINQENWTLARRLLDDILKPS